MLIQISSEEKVRQSIQSKVEEKFTDMEQSTLWLCLNDKNEELIHSRLNPIVRKHMSTTVPSELYRGVTLIEAQKLYNLAEGDTFTLGRVTSFSSDFSTAKQFASKWNYDSNLILSIQNCPWAYNYQEDITNILLGAPDEDQREDMLDMVQGECEFMLPKEAAYRILRIEDKSNPDTNTTDYTILHLELISW